MDNQSDASIYQPDTMLDRLAYSFATQPVEPSNYRNGQEIPVSMGLDVTPPDKKVVLGNYLHNLGLQHIQRQQQTRGKQFLKSVHDVMSANLTPEERVNNLIALKAQHGTDYGLGLDDIMKQLSLQAKTEEWKPKSMQEAITFERAKKSAPGAVNVLSQPEIDKINSEISRNDAQAQFFIAQAQAKGQQNPESQKDLAQAEFFKAQADTLRNRLKAGNSVPEGFEVVGYNVNGNPQVKKVSAAEKKAQLELEDRKRQQTNQVDMVRASAQDTLSTIAEVEKGMGNFGLTGNLPSIPGTDRVNWEANINKLISKTVIDLMTQMKQASKTGATGFGALSQKELQVLQNASTVIKKGMKPADAQRYLNDIKAVAQKVLSNSPQGQQSQPVGQRLTATNPQTGQKIQSMDGGQSWQLIQ